LLAFIGVNFLLNFVHVFSVGEFLWRGEQHGDFEWDNAFF